MNEYRTKTKRERERERERKPLVDCFSPEVLSRKTNNRRERERERITVNVKHNRKLQQRMCDDKPKKMNDFDDKNVL